ncbi:S1 family peptidase [Synergistaceae bacterium OttesenSCG-928-I11]|nr:S1 family peptidase [Synergistaceae bacterium OttesenSCG-928-I11]
MPANFNESARVEYNERRRAIASMMEAATVWIVAEDEKSIFNGTGFIVADGIVMTNAHVVDELGKGRRVFVVNEKIPPTEATIVDMVHDEKTDETVTGRDFALLRFSPPKGTALPVLSFSLDAQRMDRVSAWGYPVMVTQFDASTRNLRKGDTSGLKPAPVVYTEGTISSIVKDEYGAAIIHTAAIAGGNSGGPLINGRGEVVGINTWGYTEEDEGAFLNVSLPADEIVRFLQKNKVAAKLALGQTLAASPYRERPSQPTKPTGRPADKPDGGGSITGFLQPRQDDDRNRDVGSFSVRVPRGWSVLDEDDDYIFLGADDDSSVIEIMMADNDGMKLSQIAREYSEELDGTKPKYDDGLYVFAYEEANGEEAYAVLWETDDDGHVALFLAGDIENPVLAEIIDSIEEF